MILLGHVLFGRLLEGQTKYCQDNVGTATIRVGKGGSSKRKYPNASAWFRMEAICNYMVTERREEISGRACDAFENDYQGRKEINAAD